MQPDYGESPDLLEMRAKLAAMRGARRKPVLDPFKRRRDARERHEAYLALFFDNGQLRPAAAIVLDDLAEQAGLGAAAPSIDHDELCVLEGKRRLMLHLLSRFRLSAERAAILQSELENQR